ncbi:LLM class flavin-dependent oxidoreductase [Niallia sp. 01092]|uniref:LLM class flavin-dependent oxidoreductase n=1 Tax=Niallia sp. 01092 TaxID=3457759 RepID=UPI003FD1D0ED
MTQSRQIKLAAYLVGTGMHIASWRHPHAKRNASIDIDYYQDLAKKAEEGKFDVAFIADSLAINSESHPNILNRFEPITLITALANATKKIGVVATASTSYIEPFNQARLFASVDHISKGRAGWNVVTTRDLSGNTARNFSKQEHYEHDYRYERAEEFLDVVFGLWQSWEKDAFIQNKETATFYDRSKLHTLNHKGEFFQVEGPLNIGPSPQGRPVIFQAGSSPAGQRLAARSADVIFTHQFDYEKGQLFYKNIKQQIADAGRNPDDVYILQAISPIIGDTLAEAKQKKADLDALITDEQVLLFLQDYFHGKVDFHGASANEPALSFGLDTLQGVRYEFRERFQKDLLSANPTLRELYSWLTGSKEIDALVGTPEQIANELIRWFEGRVADGFMLMTPLLPDGLDEFVDKVVPLLQEKGLFRTEYEGNTLREHFGIPFPLQTTNKQSEVKTNEI